MPQMADVLLPVVDFGSVGNLIPFPIEPKGFFSSVETAAAAQWHQLALDVRSRGGAVVEVLFIGTPTNATGAQDLDEAFIQVNPATGLGSVSSQTPLNLGGPGVVSGIRAGTGNVASIGGYPLPPSITVLPLNWYLPMGSTFAMQHGSDTFNMESVLGIQWREFETVEGPE